VLALPPQPGAVQRFRMLEPIRQFALAQLEEQGLVDAVKQQALAWYGRQGKRLAARLSGPDQVRGYAYLVSEFDNLRALLSWCKGRDVAVGLQLASDLWRFWQAKGHAKEMLAWFEEVLASTQAQTQPERLRAEACNTAGSMARTCGQYAKARTLYQTSLELQRGLANRRGEASALNNLCLIARDQYDHTAVMTQGRACLAIAREIGDRNLEGLALMHLGTALRGLDRAADAQARFEESLAIFQALGETRAQATLLNFLGNLALADGRWPEAEHCFQQGLALNQALEEFWGLGISHCNLAALHLARDDDSLALAHARHSLAHYRRAGARHGMEECFDVLARLARRQGQWPRAAWCWGVVDQLERGMGKVPSPARKAQRQQELQALKAVLPPADCDAAHADGQRMSLDDALASALDEASSRTQSA
jgi:tetratricopeptide (TPR) repeat protein